MTSLAMSSEFTVALEVHDEMDCRYLSLLADTGIQIIQCVRGVDHGRPPLQAALTPRECKPFRPLRPRLSGADNHTPTMRLDMPGSGCGAPVLPAPLSRATPIVNDGALSPLRGPPVMAPVAAGVERSLPTPQKTSWTYIGGFAQIFDGDVANTSSGAVAIVPGS